MLVFNIKINYCWGGSQKYFMFPPCVSTIEHHMRDYFSGELSDRGKLRWHSQNNFYSSIFLVCVVSSAIRNCNHVAIPIMAQHAKHLCDNPCIRRFVLTFHVRRLHLHATLLLLQPSPGQERQWSQHPFIHAASTPTTPTLGLAGHNTTRSCSPGHAQTPGGAFACDVLYGAHSQPEFVVEPHLFLALVMERLRLPLDITDARCERGMPSFHRTFPEAGGKVGRGTGERARAVGSREMARTVPPTTPPVSETTQPERSQILWQSWNV